MATPPEEQPPAGADAPRPPIVPELPSLDGEIERLHRLVRGAHPDKLRFLWGDRWRAYLALLWALLERRRAHEVEVYYDDLLTAALALVPQIQAGPYDPDLFRSDIKALEEWGNIAPLRLEARRIESLADRRLQKFLCRLDDETAAFLEYAESRSFAAAEVLADRGRHFLRDAVERLREANQMARRLRGSAVNGADPGSRTDDQLRLVYLIVESDQKVDAAARELVAFDAALVSFTTNPFRLEALADVVERLEQYVEDYVSEATKQGRELQKVARAMLKEQTLRVLWEAHFAAMARLQADPFAGSTAARVPQARDILGRLDHFFLSGGRFEVLLERVHSAARDVVRRVHSHLENVRARNLRIETIRDRTREMARLEPDAILAANLWINQLFASAHVPTDIRPGTTEARTLPPRPARRYEPTRGVHRGGYLTGKQSEPEQERALERRQLLELSRFVRDRILKNRARARLSDGDLVSYDHFRYLMLALKAYKFRPARKRQDLQFRIEDSPRGRRAHFVLADGILDAPDSIFMATEEGQIE